jgi:hypothetical protein
MKRESWTVGIYDNEYVYFTKTFYDKEEAIEFANEWPVHGSPVNIFISWSNGGYLIRNDYSKRY